MTLIGLPNTLPPKSSTAIWAAVTEPFPVAADAGPLMSVRTPILTTSSETCARAAGANGSRARTASTARPAVTVLADISVSLVSSPLARRDRQAPRPAALSFCIHSVDAVNAELGQKVPKSPLSRPGLAVHKGMIITPVPHAAALGFIWFDKTLMILRGISTEWI